VSRTAAGLAVLFAVVGTALVGVRERSEARRLQFGIGDLERRRDALDRRILQLETDLAGSLAPRRLLEEAEARGLWPPPRVAGEAPR
jgi:hypothetical protein